MTKTLKERGHFIAAQALESVNAATTVRIRNGKVSVTDGPFAETNEQIGGFILIEAKDLNEAIQLASKIPVIRLGRHRSAAHQGISRQYQQMKPTGGDRCVLHAFRSSPWPSRALVRPVPRSPSWRGKARVSRRQGKHNLHPFHRRRASVMITSQIEHPKVVSRGEWLAARKELLVKEKQLTRQRDEVDRQRRELPWVKVEKDYFFDGPQGRRSLADLFEDRSQLIVSHFMFGPGWKEGCVGCSFRSDHVDGALVHLEHHDVSLVTISRAPLAEIEAFKKRMGWRFSWLSSYGSDFNYDYQVSFTTEEVATGRVTYNYEVRDFVSEEGSGVQCVLQEPGGRDISHLFHFRTGR